jgi:hypothetical protein
VRSKDSSVTSNPYLKNIIAVEISYTTADEEAVDDDTLSIGALVSICIASGNFHVCYNANCNYSGRWNSSFILGYICDSEDCFEVLPGRSQALC